jgi:flagellar motility protein MotE (MotC chaperone)
VLEQSRSGRAGIEREIEAIQAQISTIEEKQYRLAVLAEDGAIDVEAARRRTAELAEQLAAADRSLKQKQERLTTLPDPAEFRQRLERVAEHVDLRSAPLGVVRHDLLRAGVRVYVEKHKVVRIVFGEPLTES